MDAVEALSERTRRAQEVAGEALGRVVRPAATEPGDRSLDTLAQLDQKDRKASRLVNRARRMFATKPMAVRLAELRGSLEQQYRNAIYCASRLTQEGARIRGKYCGTRWCLVCSAIRTAKLIRVYEPILKTWEHPCFVTLTVPNCSANELFGVIKRIVEVLRLIQRSMRRTHKVPLVGVRKLECTFNERRLDFHPHLHLIVENKAIAELVVKLWLKRFPECSPAAQDVRPTDAQGVKELFKYFTKLTTRVTTASGKSISRRIPTEALDVIFQAMVGRRVYQPMGFTVDAPDEDAPIDPTDTTVAAEERPEPVLWDWEQSVADWVDRSTGETLTGYVPAAEFRKFVEGWSSGETGGQTAPLWKNPRSGADVPDK
jgi:hypothetical protein